LKFKFATGHTYSGRVGHKWWRAGAGATAAPTQSGTSGYVSFTFDNASTTFYGLAAVATAALAFF